MAEAQDVPASNPEAVKIEETPTGGGSVDKPAATTSAMATVGDAQQSDGICNQHRLITLGASVIIYFLLVIILYSNHDINPQEEGSDKWGVGDCMYFAVVMVTTVGYGDFLPKSGGMKIATVAIAWFGLSIVVLAFGVIQDAIVVASMNRINERRVGIFNPDKEKKQERKILIATVVAYVLFVVLGTVVFGLDIEENSKSDADPFLDGFYLTMITMTTIGFGDISPVSGHAKFIGCIVMLVGIPLQVAMFSNINTLIFGDIETRSPTLKKIFGRLDEHKFTRIADFIDDLELRGKHDTKGKPLEKISKFQYLSFLLVSNGTIDEKELKAVVENFNSLDKSGTGFIDISDAQTAQQPILKTNNLS